MFTPKALNTPRSRIGTPTPTTSFQQRRSNTWNYRNTSLSRDYGTPNRSFGTPTQTLHVSQLTEEVTHHRLDCYGGVLPVSITETLAYADNSSVPDVSLDIHGWAWLVVDNRLLVWKYKTTMLAKIHQCIELSLPSSSCKYSSAQITLLPNGSCDNPPACVAVAAEGIVRYWPNVSHATWFGEVALETKDSEVIASVIHVEEQDGSFQCIAASSLSSLFILTPAHAQTQIKGRAVKPPHSMLSGISRRMSSFIFGGGATEASPVPLHALVPGELMDNGEVTFYTLSGTNLQKWSLRGPVEKLLYEQNIEKMMSESFAQSVWHQDCSLLPHLKLWLLDLQLAGDAVIVLGAAYNPDVSSLVYYGLGTLHTEGIDAPQSFLSFTVPQFNHSYDMLGKDEQLKMKLLVPDSNKSSVYLHDNQSVMCMSVTDSNHPVDKVEFNTAGDKLLGAGCCEKSAVFFSNVHGIVAIKDSVQQPTAKDTVNQSAVINETSIMEAEASFAVTSERIEELSMSVDNIQRLKGAFLHFIKGHMLESMTIIEEILPAGVTVAPEVDGRLDRLVATLSEEMIDDVPATDPRWAGNPNIASTGSTSSLILSHQLEDKLRAHEYYMKFLKSMDLWDKLKLVTVRGNPMVTRLLLCEHAEKIVAAKALREFHTQHPELIDVAIKGCLDNRGGGRMATGLTAHDLFYREVSKLEEVLQQLVESEVESLQEGMSSQETVALVVTVNNILYNTLFEAYHYRITKTTLYQSSTLTSEGEYVPWTSSLGPRGIREVLTTQHQMTMQRALPLSHDVKERTNLYQQLMDLADMVLDGYKTQLETVRQTDGQTAHYEHLNSQYLKQRRELISPFMNRDQYERAASLAEKYCDFEMLVRLCEETGNEERLQKYMKDFESKGFADYVFRWYIEQGKRGKLMGSSLASHPQLTKFLQSGDNKLMSWLQDIQDNNYHKAQVTLLDLAREEEKYLSKKKTLLSLSKLTELASNDAVSEQVIKEIDVEQDLILNQEQIPQEVFDSLGMDADTMRVMSPQEVIQAYVSDYNVRANEYDFKKALDLLMYVQKAIPGDEYQALLIHIWCKAILKDNWLLLDTDDPLENTRDTVFYKTIDLLYSDQDMKLREYLPTADALLRADELGTLRHERNFEYLIKAGFEQINRIIAT